MSLTKNRDWHVEPNGLLISHSKFPELTFSYVAENRYCVYQWTDEQYATLAKMLPGGNTLLKPNMEQMPDKYQDLKWLIVEYSTHEKIMPFLEHRINLATSFGKEAQSVFVLMYQMPAEYLPLHINTGMKECEIIATWRLQYGTTLSDT